MTTVPTALATRKGRPAELPVPENVCSALRARARSVSSKQEVYRESLRVLARHFAAPYAAIHVDGMSGTLAECVHDGDGDDTSWKSLGEGLLLDARYRNLPVAKLYHPSDHDDTFAVMAVPIVEDPNGVVGSVVVVTRCDSKALAEPRLSEFGALVSFAGALASATDGCGDARRANEQQNHSGTIKAGGHKTMHEFAFALANGLKSKLVCEQVILGLVRGYGVQVVCMSGLDDLYPRSPGARLIQQAMEECLDAGRIVVCQDDASVPEEACSTGHLMHKAWHHQTGNSSVASLPLLVEGSCAAVLSLRNGGSSPFKKSDLDKTQQIASSLVPGLLLMERAHRSLLRHAVDTARTTAARWLGPGVWGRKALLAAVLLATTWLVFGTMEFTVAIPCEVVPDEIRQIAAPFQSTISAAHVQPGDTVAAGDVLVELDTRELSLERQRLLAELSIAELDLARAVVAKDHAAAAQAESRMEVARSELDVVSHRIAKSKIQAPAAGVILSGDVAHRVGEVVPLGEPLLQFAPNGTWAIELRAPEFAALYLAAGQAGEFTTSARPDEAQRCRLVQVDMSSEVVNGENVFVAEAQVEQSPAWIRVGMTGVARIHVGRRPVWWVGLHRTIDTVRLQLWKL